MSAYTPVNPLERYVNALKDEYVPRVVHNGEGMRGGGYELPINYHRSSICLDEGRK